MFVAWKKEWTGIWTTHSHFVTVLCLTPVVPDVSTCEWHPDIIWHLLLTKREWDRCWQGYGMTRQIVKNSGMFRGRFVILPQVEWSDLAQMHEAYQHHIPGVPITVGVSASHLSIIDCSTVPSGKTTANEAYFLQRSRCIDLGNWDFSYHRVFREGARIGKVIYWFSLAGKSTGTISHQAGIRLSFIDQETNKIFKKILN